jgi:hypothetical protein
MKKISIFEGCHNSSSEYNGDQSAPRGAGSVTSLTMLRLPSYTEAFIGFIKSTVRYLNIKSTVRYLKPQH